MDCINTCYEEWKSLYSQNLDKVWKTERKELRNIAILFHTLKQEFTRVEDKLNSDLEVLQQKAHNLDSLKEHSSNENVHISVVRDSVSDTFQELSQSPKLNKNRKMIKKCTPPLLNISKEIERCNPPLLDIPKEVTNLENALPVTHKRRTGSEDLFGRSPDSICVNIRENSDSRPFKTPRSLKHDNDVVDSSFVVTNTPVLSSSKKLKKHKNKSRNLLTVTKMFDLHRNKCASIRKHDNSSKQSVQNEGDIDETVFKTNLNKPSNSPINTSTKSSTSLPNKLAIPGKFYSDYDKIPEIKISDPEYPCKGEPVRRKADRLKLPGWSCSDCEKYYKGLNLPPEELKKKMDACSKHRAKFQQVDNTPQGFWDLDISSSSSEIIDNMDTDNDSTFFVG